MPSGYREGALRIGEWIVNPSLDSMSKGTETQKLEPRTMRLLLCLADSAGEVVSVDRLLNEVWTGVIVGSASVYQAVSQLRKLLGDVDPEPTYIATVPRKGYRLIASVKRLEPPGGIIAPNVVAPTAEAPLTAATPLSARRRSKLPLIMGAAAIIALIVVGAMIWKRSLTVKIMAVSANSIAVLPFIDMTADKSDESFCDGLTEELSSWLAQIPTLLVVARTSAFAFRGQPEDVRKIGKALDTSHILEGSIRRSGDRMRITVKLIDARTGYRLWSQDFDRPVDDAIKIQEDISRSVAGTLQVRLTSDSERQFALRRMADPRAYQLYLLGRHFAQLLTPESTEREIDLYQQVLTLEPNFAPAYAQLAYARLNQGYFKTLPIAEISAQVEPLIATALRLDDRLSAAYAVRGALRSMQDRTKEALDDLKHAISLNPSDMPAFAQIGRIQIGFGQPRDALESYDQASALDPLNFAIQGQRCTVLADLARYEEAGKACERARKLQPDAASTAEGLAWLSESQGKIDEALKWNEASLKADPGDFELYWERAMFLLSIGMAAPARTAVELGRRITKNEEDANVALVRVTYREGGSDALRRYMDRSQIEQSPHARTLFEAAYGRLLLGDAGAAKQLIVRALTAPDRAPGYAELPFYARTTNVVGGGSYRLDLAVAELALGERAPAEKELNGVLEMLNKMIGDGVERNATYELRARVYALKGQGDEAMKELDKAVKHGWRRAWWAIQEPYLPSLRQRGDFQALMAQVDRSNDRLAESINVRQ